MSGLYRRYRMEQKAKEREAQLAEALEIQPDESGGQLESHLQDDTSVLGQGEANTQDNAQNVDGEEETNETKPLTPDDVEGMDIEGVKKELDERGIEYIHNTGLKKLRDKLKEAL